jgi:hypothetical protein
VGLITDVIGVMGWQCLETLRQEAEQRLAQVTSQADQEVRPQICIPPLVQNTNPE